MSHPPVGADTLIVMILISVTVILRLTYFVNQDRFTWQIKWGLMKIMGSSFFVLILLADFTGLYRVAVSIDIVTLVIILFWPHVEPLPP